jgi:Uma2 family endonuclease
VSVYRPNGDVEVLTGEDKLAITELLLGWEVAISELWLPVFE